MSRGQASLEYLTTYVYAGLGLAIVVGALGYFGAFDQSTYSKETCESGAQVSCLDALIDSEGTMSVMIANNHGRPINITNYTFSAAGEDYLVEHSDLLIDKHKNGTLSVASDLKPSEGKKESFTYTFTYHAQDSDHDIIVSGSATTKVEEAGQKSQCGNDQVESGEECDEGAVGGWIPPGVRSCEEYLREKQVLSADQPVQVSGKLWCSSECKIRQNDPATSAESCTYCYTTNSYPGPGLELQQATFVACCDQVTDCAYDYECYDSGTKLQIGGSSAVCEQGVWLMPCENDDACGSYAACVDGVCRSV